MVRGLFEGAEVVAGPSWMYDFKTGGKKTILNTPHFSLP